MVQLLVTLGATCGQLLPIVAPVPQGSTTAEATCLVSLKVKNTLGAVPVAQARTGYHYDLEHQSLSTGFGMPLCIT